MQKSRRYLYVAFCCQQTVEKTIKALIVKQTNEFPPRVRAMLLSDPLRGSARLSALSVAGLAVVALLSFSAGFGFDRDGQQIAQAKQPEQKADAAAAATATDSATSATKQEENPLLKELLKLKARGGNKAQTQYDSANGAFSNQYDLQTG